MRGRRIACRIGENSSEKSEPFSGLLLFTFSFPASLAMWVSKLCLSIGNCLVFVANFFRDRVRMASVSFLSLCFNTSSRREVFPTLDEKVHILYISRTLNDIKQAIFYTRC